mmetsp:Transcript_5115/g.19787  ORF Transcript_5115/g.19787 Transcript_5115/m.19787 type:complete len:216 (+) Transcript_5115:911-1558(+)
MRQIKMRKRRSQHRVPSPVRERLLAHHEILPHEPPVLGRGPGVIHHPIQSYQRPQRAIAVRGSTERVPTASRRAAVRAPRPVPPPGPPRLPSRAFEQRRRRVGRARGRRRRRRRHRASRGRRRARPSSSHRLRLNHPRARARARARRRVAGIVRGDALRRERAPRGRGARRAVRPRVERDRCVSDAVPRRVRAAGRARRDGIAVLLPAGMLSVRG